MKNFLLTTFALFLLLSCTPQHRVSDNELSRFLWQNRPWNGLSFEQFQQSSRLKRIDLDVNQDGQQEILLTLTGIAPNTGDFLILSVQQGKLGEMFFTRKFGHYALDMEFHEWQNGVLLRWMEKNGGSNVRINDLQEEYIRCAAASCDSLSYERYSWTFSFASESETATSVTIAQPLPEGNTLALKQYSYQTGTTLNRQNCYDQTGVKWGSSRIQPFTILGPETLILYHWNGQSFEMLSRRETRPEMVITDSSPLNRSIFSGLLHALHDRWHGEKTDPNQIEQDFLHFFGLESPPAVPCGEETPLSLASGYADEIGVEVVMRGQGCRLQAWRQPDWHTVQTLDDIEIIGRFDFPCNPASIRLTWNDLNGDSAPEVWVSSTQQFRETLRFFQVSPTFLQLGELSGFLREPNFRGIQWKQRGENLLFYAGRPFWDQETCQTSLNCYTSLEHAFDCYEWNSQENRFVFCPSP